MLPARGTDDRSPQARRRRDDGAAAVELALVLPILLLLVFGIISFGIIFAQQLAVNNGVRQGVRSAVVAGNTAQQTCAQVLTSIQAASGPTIGMSTSDVKVQVQRVSSTHGRRAVHVFRGPHQHTDGRKRRAPGSARATRQRTPSRPSRSTTLGS